jgi:hypothetical protein
MGFFHDGESTELVDLMEQGTKTLLRCGKWILWGFKPTIKNFQKIREQLARRGEDEEMLNSLPQKDPHLRKPLSEIPPAFARPDLSPPPTRKL